MNAMMQMNNESASTLKSKIMKNMGSHCAYMMTNSTAKNAEPSTMLDNTKKLNNKKNCCTENCKCFSGMCVSAFVLNQHLTNDIIFNVHTKIISVSVFFKSQRLTSLYKPPILT